MDPGHDKLDGLSAALIGFLSGLDQALRLYNLKNDIIQRLLGEIEAVLKELERITGTPTQLSMVNFSVFLNRRLVRLSFAEYRKAQELRRVWQRLEIGEICFPHGCTKAQLETFTSHLAAAMSSPQSVDLLGDTGGGILLRPIMGGEERSAQVNVEDSTIRSFCSLIVLTRLMIAHSAEGRRPPILLIKRNFQVLVDRLEGYEGLLLALCRITSTGGELASHLVNVAFYSLLMGRRLKMDRAQLINLAMAALFHDLPKAALKPETLGAIEKPHYLNEVDVNRLRQYWISTLPQVVMNGGVTTDALVRVVVLYESQLEFSCKGLYPLVTGEHAPLALFSRIIKVGDYFDTVTRGRPGRAAQTPHQAMMSVLEGCGTTFEPYLVRVFIEELGLYPVGSAVVLNAQDVGIVVAKSKDATLEQPLVKLVANLEGKPVSPREIDLSRAADQRITWSFDPANLGINSVACLRQTILEKAP